MNPIEYFVKLLKLRTLFKRVNQFSWTLQQFERKFNDLHTLSPEEQESVYKGYELLMKDLLKICEELNDEFKPEK